jgi:hypothetical protein
MSAQPQKTSEVSRSQDGLPESVKSVFSEHPAALEAVTDWFDEKKVGHNREVTWETKGKREGLPVCRQHSNGMKVSPPRTVSTSPRMVV